MGGYLIYGKGVSGKSCYELLKSEAKGIDKTYNKSDNHKNNAPVDSSDLANPTSSNKLAKAIKSDELITLIDDSDLERGLKVNFFDYKYLVKSPGIPYNKFVQEATNAGLKVIDEIEVSYKLLKKQKQIPKIIAVTGSNGKTTVTTQIKNLLAKAGFKVEFAGNIGTPFSEVIMQLKAGKKLDYLILELSSFQLENLNEFQCDISLITNLQSDHLERYESEEAYYNTKLSLISRVKKQGTFILNKDDKLIREYVEHKKNAKKTDLPENILTISQKEVANFCIVDGEISSLGESIIEVEELAQKGAHNIENALFITSIGSEIEIPKELLREFLMEVEALPHRLETFYKWGKLTFVNDSKATNIASLLSAAKSYNKGILICGGYDKGLEWGELARCLKEVFSGEVYLIGSIRERLREELISNNYPEVKIKVFENLDEVLANIKSGYTKTDERVVFLSPGTSSYDQYKNFAERGDYFKKRVKELFN